MPGHQRHTARIASKIHWREIGIGSNNSNVKRINPQNLGDDVCQNRIRTLANIDRAAHNAYPTLPIQPELHTRMRHVVPVDWQPGATNVRAAGEANSFTVTKLLKLLVPIRSFNNFVDALAETDAPNSK